MHRAKDRRGHGQRRTLLAKGSSRDGSITILFLFLFYFSDGFTVGESTSRPLCSWYRVRRDSTKNRRPIIITGPVDDGKLWDSAKYPSGEKILTLAISFETTQPMQRAVGSVFIQLTKERKTAGGARPRPRTRRRAMASGPRVTCWRACLGTGIFFPDAGREKSERIKSPPLFSESVPAYWPAVPQLWAVRPRGENVCC